MGYCSDDVRMEEEVQHKVQVEEVEIRETHREEQGEEQSENKQTIKSHKWVTMQMT